MKNIINKIEDANLVGRGGACFPVYLKWQAVACAKGREKYLIINGAEGEPGIYKDGYIIKKYLPELSLGVKIASDYIKAEKIFFYLNHKYFKLYQKNIIKEFNKVGLKGKFIIFVKPQNSGYIGGEESTALNIIEGQHLEPRLRPPFPTEKGLFGKPTLINNVETLFNVGLVSQNKYENKRFYSINIGSKNKGVYFLSSDLTIKEILQQTNNYPKYSFFVQVGGDASGEVLNQKQLDQEVSGAGSITIHNLKDHQPFELINYWLRFFADSSCGQCTPCREGTYRLLELFNNVKNKNKKGLKELYNNQDYLDLCQSLRLSSFCALGCSVPIAISSYFKNILNI